MPPTPYTDLSSHGTLMISTTALTMIGNAIRESAADPRTAENIRTMHQTTEGAEILRLIVRDDLGGAADIITSALWVNL